MALLSAPVIVGVCAVDDVVAWQRVRERLVEAVEARVLLGHVLDQVIEGHPAVNSRRPCRSVEAEGC